MFVITLSRTSLKKLGLGAMCCALVVCSAMLGRYISTRTVTAAASVNKIESAQDIQTWFTGYGLEVDGASITADKVKIPRKWDDSFSAFNGVVQQSGMDLTRCKGSKERVVPKSPALSKQLVKYCTLRDGYLKDHPTRYKNLFPSKNGKPMTDEAVARILRHAAKEVGVSSSVRVSPHTCRHTFAQMQLKNGLDLYSVSRLMGHVNIMITQRYLLGIKDKDIVDRGTQTSPLMNL